MWKSLDEETRFALKIMAVGVVAPVIFGSFLAWSASESSLGSYAFSSFGNWIKSAVMAALVSLPATTSTTLLAIHWRKNTPMVSKYEKRISALEDQIIRYAATATEKNLLANGFKDECERMKKEALAESGRSHIEEINRKAAEAEAIKFANMYRVRDVAVSEMAKEIEALRNHNNEMLPVYQRAMSMIKRK